MERAKHYKEISFQNLMFAESRSSELADAFTALEVGIATVLIAFSGLFTESFLTGLKGYSGGVILSLKWLYVLSVLCTVLSLLFGLIHIKMKENFWNKTLSSRQKKYNKWQEVFGSKSDDKEAEAYAYVKGVSDAGGSGLAYTPVWTWIVQTVLLGAGVLLIMLLFFTLVFYSK